MGTKSGNLPAFNCCTEIPISAAQLDFGYLKFTTRYYFITKSFIGGKAFIK